MKSAKNKEKSSNNQEKGEKRNKNFSFGLNSPKYASKTENKDIILLFSEFLKEKHNLEYSREDVLKLIEEEKKTEKIEIPLSVFCNSALSSLEIITKYLKEELKLSYVEIASLLNRDQRTIWSTYSKAIQKFPGKFEAKHSKFSIPVEIFANRKFGVLEILVEYLKDEFMLSYHEIAVLLQKNDRTIWTSYHRIKQKKKKEANGSG